MTENRAGSQRDAELTVESLVAAPRERVWERVSTPAGINAELMPLMKMRLPRGVRNLDVDSVPVGRRLGRCPLLLLGFLPFDWDDLVIVRLDPPGGFLERSSMLSMRLWEHERTLETAGPGCRVRDRVRFEPRLRLQGRLLLPLVRAIFHHRHRRLRRQFGSLEPGS
jgi:ligand-binding SRPBCC domain-containing protein